MHSDGRLFSTRFKKFLCVEISIVEWLLKKGETCLHDCVRQNIRRVSNTCDLRRQLNFAQLDARIVLDRDRSLTRGRFQHLRVSVQSRAGLNSKSQAIYKSPRHSAMHKCFCESLAAIILNVLHKILRSWYETACIKL